MMNPYSRTRLLLGEEGMERLRASRVAVFGLGGVGGYVVEALARSGIGALELVDHDTISFSNLNRQLLATRATVGMDKADAARDRVLSIDPDIQVTARKIFFLPETADQFDFTAYDYVVDAIDTVTGKLMLIQAARQAGTPIICSMGTGNKLDPSGFVVADIYKTSGCHLARIMRRECRKRGISHLDVVYSPEEPIKCSLTQAELEEMPQGRNTVPGSCAFVPAAAAMVLAGHVVRQLAGI